MVYAPNFRTQILKKKKSSLYIYSILSLQVFILKGTCELKDFFKIALSNDANVCSQNI